MKMFSFLPFFFLSHLKADCLREKYVISAPTNASSKVDFKETEKTTLNHIISLYHKMTIKTIWENRPLSVSVPQRLKFPTSF